MGACRLGGLPDPLPGKAAQPPYRGPFLSVLPQRRRQTGRRINGTLTSAGAISSLGRFQSTKQVRVCAALAGATRRAGEPPDGAQRQREHLHGGPGRSSPGPRAGAKVPGLGLLKAEDDCERKDWEEKSLSDPA